MAKLSKLEKYLLNIDWRPVYLNAVLTNYEISSNGFLKNIKTGRIRKWQKSEDGYYKCTITINNHHFKVGYNNIEILDHIMSIFNLPDRRSAQHSVYDIISRFKNQVSGSSTIDQLH